MLTIGRRELPAYLLAGGLALLVLVMVLTHHAVPSFVSLALIGALAGALGLTNPAGTGTADDSTKAYIEALIKAYGDSHADVADVLSRLDTAYKALTAAGVVPPVHFTGASPVSAPAAAPSVRSVA